MIEQSAARLFAENVDKALLERFEKGEWPDRLWRLVADNGLTLALASEASGGIGATWSDAYPILRGLGYWQVPLPLAETMIASLLLSAAGIAIPEGPIAVIDEADAAGLTLAGGAGALRASGTARRVGWARHCRFAVLAQGGAIALIDLAGARITPRVNTACEPEDEVVLSAAPCVARAGNLLPVFVSSPFGERTQLDAVTRGENMNGLLEKF